MQIKEPKKGYHLYLTIEPMEIFKKKYPEPSKRIDELIKSDVASDPELQLNLLYRKLDPILEEELELKEEICKLEKKRKELEKESSEKERE